MTGGYAKGGIIQDGPTGAVGYAPDSDGPLLAPGSRDKYQAALERINLSTPVED